MYIKLPRHFVNVVLDSVSMAFWNENDIRYEMHEKYSNLYDSNLDFFFKLISNVKDQSKRYTLNIGLGKPQKKVIFLVYLFSPHPPLSGPEEKNFFCGFL